MTLVATGMIAAQETQASQSNTQEQVREELVQA
jgi:hypothetical protein